MGARCAAARSCTRHTMPKLALSVKNGPQGRYCYRGDVRRRTEDPALTLAERKRQLVRDELAEAALRLLARQGFEETTVDELAAAAGVSRRTFFRYFASKEDVVISSVVVAPEGMVAEVAPRPAEEPPAVAIREAVKVVTME